MRWEDLRPREQRVLDLRFGLSDGKKLSLRAVGSLLKISKERVKQIEVRGLEKLELSGLEFELATVKQSQFDSGIVR